MARPFTTGGAAVLSHTAAEGAFAKFVCGGVYLRDGRNNANRFHAVLAFIA